MVDFLLYYGLDGATHEAHFHEHAAQGWRLEWLNISGDTRDPRYASIWVPNDGRVWYSVAGVDIDTYRARYNQFVAAGCVPSCISTTGEGQPLFAAVFDQRPLTNWFSLDALSWPELEAKNDGARMNGQIPRALAMYGPPGNRRFAGIWWPNLMNYAWDWVHTPAADYQRWFNALTDGGDRVVSLASARDESLLAVFRNDRVGGATAAHGRSADDYSATNRGNVDAGRRPVTIAVGGSPGDATFAGSWAAQLDAPERRVTLKGPGSHVGNGFDDQIDAVVVEQMKRSGVRAGSLAICRGGRVLHQRAYTWAEEDYRVVRPTDVFRLASVSKMFTTALATNQIRDELLTADTTLFPSLGFTAATDARTDKATVGHVLDNKSGLKRDLSKNFHEVSVASGHPAPPTLDDMVRAIRDEAMFAEPGTTDQYSNLAFTVLNRLLEVKSQRSYIDDLRARVLEPLGISDVRVASSRPGPRPGGEVATYDTNGVGASAYDNAADAIAPNAYGGSVFTDTIPGGGGLVASATSVAILLGSHNVWGRGGRGTGERDGSMPGTDTAAVSRGDGIDFAVLFNRQLGEDGLGRVVRGLNRIMDAFSGQLMSADPLPRVVNRRVTTRIPPRRPNP